MQLTHCLSISAAINSATQETLCMYAFIVTIIIILGFGDRISLCNLGHSGTHSVDQDGF